ncbi:hypothetical protein CCACVL1_23591 [Corchorus capsularis]|uniref:Uncharacterized protein n=1 Tax=Corchorus capsularis TaxID=210143 RepID=A0A1R3GT94_COCAP|nr:hypothetical protein CCACVL1_23591 [Corchorus capsularis]
MEKLQGEVICEGMLGARMCWPRLSLGTHADGLCAQGVGLRPHVASAHAAWVAPPTGAGRPCGKPGAPPGLSQDPCAPVLVRHLTCLLALKLNFAPLLQTLEDQSYDDKIDSSSSSITIILAPFFIQIVLGKYLCSGSDTSGSGIFGFGFCRVRARIGFGFGPGSGSGSLSIFRVRSEFLAHPDLTCKILKELKLDPTYNVFVDAPKAYHGRNDTPRTYHGLEDKHGEHGKDVQGLQGSMKMHGDHGDIDNHVPSTKNMTFDPLKMPNSPMTRARAKRFKDALMGLVRAHLEDLKTIEVQLKSFVDDLGKKLQINYKFITLLAIDSRWPD